MCSTIRDLYTRFKDNIIWIGGDSSLPDIDWKDDSYTYPATINQAYLDLVSDIGSQQIINFPTRQQNILDIFISNRPSLICKNTTLPGLSDHEVVLVDSNIILQRPKPMRRLIHIWAKADIPAMEKEMNEFASGFHNTRHLHLSTRCGWTSRENAMRSSILTYHQNIDQRGIVSHGVTRTYKDVAGERSEPTREPSVLNVHVTGIASANSRLKTRNPARMRITPM